MKTFIEEATDKLNTISACTGDTAVLAHLLSQAIDELEAVTAQAQAQFNAGDRYASFNKQFIERLSIIEIE